MDIRFVTCCLSGLEIRNNAMITNFYLQPSQFILRVNYNGNWPIIQQLHLHICPELSGLNFFVKLLA